MKKVIVSTVILILGIAISWYVDFWHKPVEKIDDLIGQNLDFAQRLYFKTAADSHYKINIHKRLNEVDASIKNKKNTLTDSLVDVFTWQYLTHKKMIWVAQTIKMESEVIDAIRYHNSVQF